MSDFATGLKSLSGLRILTPEQSDYVYDAAKALDAALSRIRELTEALTALELQALQSSVNDPANEWGKEALAMARAALSSKDQEKTNG